MNINRSYLRGAIIAIVVMIGTISAAYAAPTTSFVISGSIFYGNYSECNNSTVNITNLNTSGTWLAETNGSSNYYQMVLDSGNVSANNTLQFNVLSLDESQSSVTEHVVTSEEMGDGGFVYNITLAEPEEKIPPAINSVELNLTEVAPNEPIAVTVNVTDASGIASVTANNEPLLFVANDTYVGTITAESAVGTHNVTVVATDAAGNVAKDNETTYVVQEGEKIPPAINSVELNLTEVAPNEPIAVTVNVTDASGIASVTANNEPLLFVANDTYVGTITAESAVGTHNVTVVATDAAGNVAKDNETTYVVQEGEKIPPAINSVELNLTEVAPNEPIAVTVNVTDASGIASVTANNEPLLFVANDTYVGTITAESVVGTHNVTVVATDAAGNVAKDNETTYVVQEGEKIPPAINSVELNLTEVAPNEPIAVTVNVTDASGIASVTANNEPLLFVANDTYVGTITAESVVGTHNVTVVATDAAGNVAKDNETTYVVQEGEKIPPAINSVELNLTEVAPNEPIAVTVNVTDASGIASVTANNEPLLFVANDTYVGTITAESAVGTHNVTVVATDAAGNVAKDNETTYVVQEGEKIPPAINSVELNLTEVAPNEPIAVTVNVTDASGIASVTANNEPLLFVANDTYVGTITAESAVGTHNVTVVATDAAGNVAKDNETTYVVQEGEKIPPAINSVELNLTEVAPNEPIAVTVNVTDASGIASVTANNEPLLFVANDTYVGTITAESAVGTHNVTVVATDAAGNVAKDNETTYVVQEGEKIPPAINSVELNLTEVAPNEPIAVTVNVTDASGIASVTANNEPLLFVANDTYVGTITAESVVGTHNVTVVATDAAGNVAKDNETTYVVQEGEKIPPAINSVELNLTEVAPNEPIAVTVNVTDASGIASVTANNEPLLFVANDTYVGTITAESAVGTHNVTVVATDAAGNVAKDNETTYEVVIDTPPEIVSVDVNPAVVAPGESITVTVNVTDAESDVVNVTANGDELAFDNGTWEGTITAESAVGTHNVTVVATDAAGNVAKDNETTYEVQEPVPPTLSIEDVAVRRGETKTVPITVFDVVNMGGCIIKFTYDPAVVHVTDVARGDMNYSFTYNINNGSGWMQANAIDDAGQSGNVTFAYVTLAAIGNKSDTSKMEFEDSRLIGAYTNIAHITRNGTFSILPNVVPEVMNVSATPGTILYDNDRPRTLGTNVTSLSAYMTDTDGSITAVTINLSSIGGSPIQPMEHVSEDVWAVNTTATEVDINAPDFTHQLTITATDDDGGINDSVSIELTVLKRGDVNGDGLVNKTDADYISRYLAGLEPEASNPPVKLVGDVVGEAGNPMGDGVVDLMDALYIARYTSNMEEEP